MNDRLLNAAVLTLPALPATRSQPDEGRGRVTGRARLAELLSAEALFALEQLVDERVAQALAASAPRENGAPPWLTLEQAAERLDCSTDAVRMRVKRGRLEHRRQGRRVYVSRQSVDGLA